MPTNILMPALSPTMEKGNLAKWLKKEGDRIKSGDVLAEIETDKATMEVEAVDEGVLAKITVPDGTPDVPVNQVIGVIAAEGEDPTSIAATEPGSQAGPGEASAPKKADDDMKVSAEAQQSYARSNEAPQGPAEPATQASAAQQAARPNGAGTPGGRIFASPLARRIAKEGGLDLSQISGSGPHGRIVQADVKAAIEGGAAKPAAERPLVPQAGAPSTAPLQAPAGAPAMSDEQIKKFFQPGSFEEIPHDNMRKTIARRLAASMQSTPHFYLTVDCDLEKLLKLREELNAAAPKDKDGKPAYKLSVNDFMIKAHALALMQVPAANVSWTEGSMLRHKHVDIGVAVAIPDGLITPIVRKADTMSLSAISNAMKDFGARAKARKLKPDEYQGGSTALSNLGMYGIKQFTAIINPPHSSILAVGAGEKRVVVRGDAPAVATVMSATLSCDHRAIDGALGAEVIAAFRQLVENPMAMLV
ncbi:pyruvate dehydrogenase complex dihydrolipoamide acetyltransferase [Enterovirga aerilata]|uniref:Acetyltransferase component of pyruvate dehydrogenase complex n=1 Tax=Enterovirga aerilata TaxID=2730920 RepID=A0A849HXX4_9HYPH|nr:pyruvate dehydrogenase complex dihydrolipoamide acetyltransferase [Enterovirga sp. DB1703]NNM71962.1 pyruvate dehydrogenase complex dihydrolipoamide acetyltransferase [Enterovirga sp. DB1703]